MDRDIDVKEIQKDINDFLTRKYGKRVRFTGLEPLQQQAGNKSGEGVKQEKKDECLSINFDMKPEELKSYLDEYIVKQDEAKEVLSTKICTHFNRIKMFDLKHKKRRHERMGEVKNNIIMLGPTGVGKTFLVKLIAKKIGVPFVKGDATKFSETGYVGGDVEDLVRDLVHEAKGDIELAQYGIIYLDEIDKIAASPTTSGPDVSRSGVQRALLKPMEETDVELKVPHDPVSQMEAIMEFQKTGKREKKKINSKNILFIMSGSFSGLEELIKNRLNRQGIGFGAEIKCKDENFQYMKKVKAEDLIQYGFESEFIGRLPVITVFDQLEVEDLYNILRSPTSSIIIGKKRDFKAYGIDLQFEDEALRQIAENAFKEKTGARGLNRALERVLIKFEHALPSTNIRHLVITRTMVDDPAGELQKLLQNPEDTNKEALFNHLLIEEQRALEKSLRKKEAEFQQHYGIKFSDRRINIITKRIVEERLDLDSVVEELLAVYKEARDFEQGFTLRNNIKLSFNEEAIDCLVEKVWENEVDLNSYLKQSFQNYEHGLKLINEKTGKFEFSIPPNGVENPEEHLNDLIRDTYR